jgi:hypothetical protein
MNVQNATKVSFFVIHNISSSNIRSNRNNLQLPLYLMHYIICKAIFFQSAEENGTIKTDDINNEILPFVQELTERDRKLFNFAKKEISKEASKLNIKNATVCIEFQDREYCYIGRGERDQQYIRIAMEDDTCTMVWERQWPTRKICRSIINVDLSLLMKFAGMAGTLMIGYGKNQFQ